MSLTDEQVREILNAVPDDIPSQHLLSFLEEDFLPSVLSKMPEVVVSLFFILMLKKLSSLNFLNILNTTVLSILDYFRMLYHMSIFHCKIAYVIILEMKECVYDRKKKMYSPHKVNLNFLYF